MRSKQETFNTVVAHLRRAYWLASTMSDDPDTNNGAVLVDASGEIIGESANRFPCKIAVTPERQQRPAKYEFMVHAERGAIFQAARFGRRAQGGTLYVPWFACIDCGQAIIQAGIAAVVGHRDCLKKTPERWRESIAKADALLDEAGVRREYIEGAIGGVQIQFNGEAWQP